MNTHISLKPIGEVLKEAWVLYRKHMNTLALVSIIPLIFAAVGMTLRPELALNRGALIGTLAVVAVFNILNLIFSFLMPLAVISTIDEVSHGRTMDLNAAYKKAFSVAIPYLFVLLLTVIVTLGGSILFIIPGIIASVYMIFSIYAFLFEGKRGMDALIQSAWYVRGLWFDVLARKISIGIFVIIGMIIFSIVAGALTFFAGFGGQVFSFLVDLFAYMLIVPFSLCFSYIMYKDFKASKAHAEPTAAFVAEAEKIFIILLLIATLAALAFFFFWSFGSHPFFGHMMQMHGGNGVMIQYTHPHGFMGN